MVGVGEKSRGRRKTEEGGRWLCGWATAVWLGDGGSGGVVNSVLGAMVRWWWWWWCAVVALVVVVVRWCGGAVVVVGFVQGNISDHTLNLTSL